MRQTKSMDTIHWLLLIVFTGTLAWSAYDNHDYVTWAMEAVPGILAVTILALTFKRFRFTTLVYMMILVHCVILFIGAKYTYAKVPLFDWLRDYFDMARNNYDKLGHFAQGFVPALVAREMLVRLRVVNGRGWMNLFVVSICMSVSALYESIEWIAAEIEGGAAEAFLGTQGYEWDTQSDMLFALLGALCAILFFSRVHDQAIKAEEKLP